MAAKTKKKVVSKKVTTSSKPRAGVKKAATATGGLEKAIGEALAIMAASKKETDAKIAASDAKIADSDAKIAASDAKIAEALASMATSKIETDAKMAETEARLAASIAETNRVFQNSMTVLSRNVGDVNNRFGEIIELVVLPGLLGEMNKQCGLKFDNVSPRKRFTDGGQEYAEIDLFLENGESVMAVEAKARFTLGMVNHFVRRVESLREHEVEAGVVGKTIYAAIAAIGIDENVRKFASEKGLYLVEVNNSNSNVSIHPPKEVIGKW